MLEQRTTFWKRYVIGGLLIVLAAGAATGVAAFHEIDKVVNAFKSGNTISLPQDLQEAGNGKPQTILLIGADQRAKGAVDYSTSARSDTMMLVRLDPSKSATALMSLPRDLKVSIPGHGVDKLNAAYSEGGVKLTVRTIKKLTGLGINHVVNIDFRGFRKAIDALGCVFADVDRRYYNQTGNYAKIDIQPGYQKICGQPALDYVRYRHNDNDIVRSARQQDFLRQIKQQIGVSKLIAHRDKLITIFGRYTQSDIGSDKAVLRLLNLVVNSASHPIHEIHFTAKLGPSFVTASHSDINKLAQEFLGATAPPVPKTPKPKSRKGHHKKGRGGSGLTDTSSSGKQVALQLVTGGARGMRLYYPRGLVPGSMFLNPPRAYTIRPSAHKKYPAYRIVISTGKVGEYYGLQGTTWASAPILRSPSATTKIGGEKFRLYRDGARTRLVAWQSGGAVYWISNTLSEMLTEKQMLAVARSAKSL
ncbi:MAG: polyisoprenyl-teichoic acid--peptidoglycan teichoic acid transferase [Thermoleophilaceae bacterium]|nr:polyisoprenyl-teichoic acid--peptidoglycan teichoic acid transferase [Thermoleophilaceae bacterium]